MDSYIWKMGDPDLFGELLPWFARSLSIFGCTRGAGNVFSLPLAACDCPAVGLRVSSKSSLLSLISAHSVNHRPLTRILLSTQWLAGVFRDID